MRLYTGIDLHSSNSYLAIIDETGKRVFKRKLPNDPEQILSALAPYKYILDRGDKIYQRFLALIVSCHLTCLEL